MKKEDYWGDVPLLDEVEFRPIPEAATQMIELETGGVDMVLRVRAGDLDRIQDNPDPALYSTPDYNARYVFYNVSREPMDQLALRQAISHAIPVDMILEAFLGESVIRTYGVMPEASWAYHGPEHTYDYDPELAQSILQEAGWEYDGAGRLLYDGEPLVLDLYTPDGRYPMDKEIAAVLQHSLDDIGIGAEISVLEWGAYLSAVDGGVPHLSILGWSQATGEPATMYGPQLKSQEAGGWANAMFHSNPALDALLVEGEIEADLEKRIAIYAEAQEMVAADVPLLPMFSENLIDAAANHVQGYQHSPAGFALAGRYAIMLRHIARRVASLVPVMLGVSVTVFLILQITPGDPARLMAGQQANPQVLANIRTELGLDLPLPVQYWNFLRGAVQGDLGRSYRSGRPVMDEIRRRLPYTLELAAAGMVFALSLGLSAGILAAYKRQSYSIP